MDQPRAFSDALPPHVSAAARELADFTQFAEILRRHLAEVSQTTEAAGMDILTRLIEIENAIHTLVAHVGIAVEAGPVVAAVTQTMEGMKASQEIVARMKSDLDANAEKAAARLTAVQSRAAALDDLVEAVRRVAKQTYFLSINASIEATRAGQSAGGFAIVAKEVRELSKEVEDVSNKIGDGITALASSLDETLTSVVADHHRREVENFSALSATFTHVGTCVANIMTHQGLLLAEVKRQGEALVQPINALAASIQFQDITRQQLGHVDTSLCNMAGHYVDLAKALRSGTALPVGNVTQYIDEMYSGYVMQQQRDAHGSADTGPGKVIELF